MQSGEVPGQPGSAHVLTARRLDFSQDPATLVRLIRSLSQRITAQGQPLAAPKAMPYVVGGIVGLAGVALFEPFLHVVAPVQAEHGVGPGGFRALLALGITALLCGFGFILALFFMGKRWERGAKACLAKIGVSSVTWDDEGLQIAQRDSKTLFAFSWAAFDEVYRESNNLVLVSGLMLIAVPDTAFPDDAKRQAFELYVRTQAGKDVKFVAAATQ